MSSAALTLVCFAVKEEAKPFQAKIGNRPHVEILLTGMGQSNAERSFREALGKHRPELVLSCGFAGGLRTELLSGAVLFSANWDSALAAALLAAGARRARFHCGKEVVGTSEKKRALWQLTGADAVEMESAVIVSICEEQKIPCAIVRVILDPAEADLPLDFNRLMTRDQKMDYWKLGFAIAKSPWKIGALLRLQKQSEAASEKLAEVLLQVAAR
jgi:nucleoside phosphorylase